MKINYNPLKTNILYYVLIILSSSLYSCRKEIQTIDTKNIPNPLTVQDAKAYFENNHKNTNNGIDWNRAIILNSNSPGRIIKVPVVENLVKNNWILKDLMFQKDTAGNIQEVVYALSVDTSYFSNKKRGNKKIINLRREINDKDFTGKILLYTVNNKLIKGREYLNGILIHDILPKTSTRPGGKLMWTDPDKDKQQDIDKGIPLEEVDITAPHILPDKPDLTLPTMPDWSFPGGSINPGDYIPGGDPVGGNGDSGSNGDLASLFKNYPCAAAVAAKLPTLNTDIAALLQNTFSQNGLINLTFEPDSRLAGTTTDGRFNQKNETQSGASYVIGINPDILNNSTKEYILVTLYHEGLHAYFAQKQHELGDAEFNRQFLGMNVNGGRLIAVQDEHWPMGYDSYVRGLKDAILAFNPGFGEDRALVLAKCGIIQLSPAESTVNSQERDTRNPGFKGTKCP